MNDKIVEIEIFGQRYRIRVKGEEDEQYIGRLTAFVDQKMREIADKSKSSDALKVAVLAALNIADDYFLSRKQLDQLNEVLSRMEREIDSLENRVANDDQGYTKRQKVPS
ncbi:MAG: cell division protein ZapA [Candidatus Aminicenantes bacterium]|nr:cell division protein ZapA [Candidatus Aminicenantes bacterium]